MMKDNDLLMVVIAFVFGFMLQGMMKNMCGGRLVEGAWMGKAAQYVENATSTEWDDVKQGRPGGGVLDGGLCTFEGNECAVRAGSCNTVACDSGTTNRKCVRACGGARGNFPATNNHTKGGKGDPRLEPAVLAAINNLTPGPLS